MQALRSYFDRIDETLQIVRDDVHTYTRQVDDIELIHRDILKYVNQSQDKQLFLARLSDALISELNATDAQISVKDAEIRDLKKEIEDLNRRVLDTDGRINTNSTEVNTLREQLEDHKLWLADAETRLEEEKRAGSDLRTQLDTAQREQRDAEQRLSSLPAEQSAQIARLEQQHQQTIRDITDMVRQRGEAHSNAMVDLQREVTAANDKMYALRKQMEATQRTTTTLAAERDEKVSQLNRKLQQMAGTARGRAAMENDLSELGIILKAAEREITYTGTGTNIAGPSSPTASNFTRPRPPGRPRGPDLPPGPPTY